MKKFLLFWLLTPLVYAQDLGGDVVSAVLRNPGHWEQNCRVGFDRVNSLELPTRGYRRFWTDYRISAENWQKLRNHRSEVLRELSRRMLALKPKVLRQAKYEYCYLVGDLTRARQFADFSPQSDEFEIFLDMIQELEGVEAVPALLEIERELNARPLWMAKPAQGSTLNRYGVHVQTLSVLSYLVHQRTGELDFLPKYANYSSHTRNQIVAAASRL